VVESIRNSLLADAPQHSIDLLSAQRIYTLAAETQSDKVWYIQPLYAAPRHLVCILGRYG
jgi:hypothetical protein